MVQKEIKENDFKKGELLFLTEKNGVAEALYQITLEANQGHTTWKVSSFQYELQNERNLYIGYQVEGKLVGFIGCLLVADEASINNFAVLPSYKRKGIGTVLLEKLIEEGLKQGIHHFFLEVRVSNEAAISLYKKLGFERIAFRKDYYLEPVEDAYVLYLQKEEPCFEVEK